MRTLSFGIVILLSIILSHCGQNTISPNEIHLDVSEEEMQSITAFIELANIHRISIGCQNDIIWDDTLGMIAQMHSQDMNEHDYLAHTNLNNQSPWDRLTEQQVYYTAAAENIAQNNMRAESVFHAWMNSPEHRANLENCVYTHHGVGLSAPGVWTHLFIRR